jgi:intracellular multiplication protein IcmP
MPPQPQENSDENGPLWLTILAILVIFVVWYLLHQQITYFILKLKYYEALLIQPLVPAMNRLITDLKTISYDEAGNIKFYQLSAISSAVGVYIRYPLMAILIGLAGVLYFGNVATRYRATYSMKSLSEQEKVIWPQISPVTQIDLLSTPLDQAPWAMALNPLNFAKKYKLLSKEKLAASEEELSLNYKLNVKLKRTEAKQVFLMQLGNYWRDVESLPIHIKALFAMFAAKSHGDKTAVTALNNQISISASKGDHIDYQGVEQLLAKYAYSDEVRKITSRHAFIFTVMIHMLEYARQDGVYASADFLWLKPIDRRLWYTLNCAGRKTPYAEVAGIFSHYYAETIYQQAIFVPMVDEAVDALEIAITEYIHKPED